MTFIFDGVFFITSYLNKNLFPYKDETEENVEKILPLALLLLLLQTKKRTFTES
jgi:hypothetical protein